MLGAASRRCGGAYHGTKIVVRPGPVYFVSFCTHSPDDWGDVYSWRFLLGAKLIEVEQFPIYRAARVLE